MGVGKQNEFKSDSIEYSTPKKIVEPLIIEFALTKDVCASALNHKLPDYWTKEDNALAMNWDGNCWMNPPFSKDLNKWVKKASNDSERFGGTKVCLIPVRSNTKWWAEIAPKSEIRFINGEVNFNEEERGLWLPMCIMIFGERARVGKFFENMKLLLSFLIIFSCKTYAQKNPTNSPVGGGLFYSQIFTTGDIIVHDAHELLNALIPENTGKRIYIDADSIDLSMHSRLPLYKGMTLCSNRGKSRNKPGCLLYSNTMYNNFTYTPLFITAGDSVRITGLRMRGASGEIHDGDYERDGVGNAIQGENSYLQVDNCELYNWNKWAIWLRWANYTHINHNHLHHNRLNGFGYALWVGGSEYINQYYIGGGCTIEANLFEYNRHAVDAASNLCSYYARYNVVQTPHTNVPFARHSNGQRGGMQTIISNNILFTVSNYGVSYPSLDSSSRLIISENWFETDSPAGSVDRPVDVDTSFKQVFIENNYYRGEGRTLPVAVLKCNDTTGIAPKKLIFDGAGSFDTTGLDIIRYVFRWGDGTETVKRFAGRVPHQFKEVGQYVVSLTVYNRQGIPSYPVTQRIYITHTYQRAVLSVWIKDSYPGKVWGKYFKQILLDGRPVWESDAAGDSGWEHAVVNLTPYVDYNYPVHTLQVRILARTQTASIKEMSMWIDGFSITNSSFYRGDFDADRILYPPWRLAYYRVNGSSPISAGVYADEQVNGDWSMKFRFVLGGTYYSGAYAEMNYQKLIFY